MAPPFYSDDSVTVHHGDCLDVLKTLPTALMDSVVTDPPYELGFMGKGWDASGIAYNVGLWAECLRVLKPGGHMLAFGGTRTWHRLACAIEDAGFEIRDTVASLGGGDSAGLLWMHGQGFPKSHNLPGGFGTALKPAFEPIVVARKPLSGTVAANVTAHGTGAFNIAATRVGAAGRWPANVVLSHAPACEHDGDAGCVGDGCPVAKLDSQSGNVRSGGHRNVSHTAEPQDIVTMGRKAYSRAIPGVNTYSDSGAASRLFSTFRYQAKAPSPERPKVNGVSHPTVKPLGLMSWLVRLVTPPGGTVLEPFAGSGTTVEACLAEGFRCVAIEREVEYLPLILARIERQVAPSLEREYVDLLNLLEGGAA